MGTCIGALFQPLVRCACGKALAGVAIGVRWMLLYTTVVARGGDRRVWRFAHEHTLKLNNPEDNRRNRLSTFFIAFTAIIIPPVALLVCARDTCLSASAFVCAWIPPYTDGVLHGVRDGPRQLQLQSTVVQPIVRLCHLTPYDGRGICAASP